jgi:hypothetical protein
MLDFQPLSSSLLHSKTSNQHAHGTTPMTNHPTPAFDLTAYYPTAVKPIWMTSIRNWYISTYGDRFFYAPP